MANARLEELKARFDENPRRYFAPYANELRKTGDLAQAVSICRSHLAVQPGHVSGHIVLAQALSESGELDDSRAEFEAALELDPENLIALRAMGDIARARGDAAVAREWYQRVLDADPRNEEIARTLREMATTPNEFAPPAAAPAPLSMLVSEGQPAGTADVARDLPAPPASEAVSPSPVPSAPEVASAAPLAAEATTEELPVSSPRASAPEPPRPEPVVTEPQAAAADLSDPMDDFVPFESIDSFDVPGDDRSVPPPPSVAAESVDLSDFTMMDPDGVGQPREPEPEAEAAHAASAEEGERPAAAYESPAEPPAVWTDEDESADEFAFGDQSAAAASSEGEATDDTPAAPHAAWMSRMTPAANLSDYEAAPDFVFEAEPSPAAPEDETHAEWGAASPPAPSPSAYEDDVESWFNTGENTASTAQSGEATDGAQRIDSDPVSEPEPVRAEGGADPVVGQTPPVVEAVQETPAAPFVTETLAELYLQQGFRDEALSIYRQLMDRNPTDMSLRRRAEAIERGAASDVVPDIAARSSTAGHRDSMSVRTFFGRLARRAPSRPASGGGSGRGSRTTGSWEAIGARQGDASADPMDHGGYRGPVLETAGHFHAAAEHAEPPAPAAHAEHAAHAEQPSALATLFAAARPSESDTRAAAALASAFTESPSVLPPSGRPSRTAERELSLDHLFRDEASGADMERAPSAGSMDDFYRAQSPLAPPSPQGSPGSDAAGPGAGASGGSGHAPDERGTDLRQFTAWLEGLKKK